MKKYKFILDISKQNPKYAGMEFTKIIKASDKYEAFSIFYEAIERDGRFLAIEDDIYHEELD